MSRCIYKYFIVILLSLLYASNSFAQSIDSRWSIEPLKKEVRVRQMDSLKVLINNATDSVKINSFFSLINFYEIGSDSIDFFIKRAEIVSRGSNLYRIFSKNAIVFCSTYPVYPSTENNIEILRKLKLSYQVYYDNYQLKNNQFAIKAVYCIVNFYAVIGDYEKAILFKNKHFHLLKKKSFQDSSLHYSHLGWIYNNEGIYKKALENYNKALKITINHPHKPMAELITVTFLCEVYFNNEQFDKVIELSNKFNNKFDTFKSTKVGGYRYYDNLIRKDMYYASSLGMTNQLMLSANKFEALIDFVVDSKNESYLPDIFSVYAEILRKQKNYKKSISLLEKAFNLVNYYDIDIEKKVYLLQQLSTVYEEIGEIRKSLSYYKKYSNAKDSLVEIKNKENNFKMAASIGAEFEFKKEIENEKNEKNKQVQLSSEKERKSKQIICGILGGLIIVLLVAFFILKLLFTMKKQKLTIETQKIDVERKNYVIEEKQKEILDSINYAKRIQYTLLAHDTFLKKNLRENFTFFNPKDIVSGDFYWATKHNNKFYLAVCDSTGHGVPGAFMSLLNIGFLSEAINEKGIEKPNEVFDFVRMKLIETISKDGQRDGLDGILICIDLNDNTITYAAANNAPVLIQDGQLTELPADRMPVGLGERKDNFSLYKIDAKSGNMLYLYTDGYADQFGGPKGKKFKYKTLNALLLANHHLPLPEQHSILNANFNSWKGNLEQVDDVCLIGLMV